MKKTLGFVGLAAITLGSSLSAVPAFAAASGCGPKPTGGTLTESNGVCTLKFTRAGNYTFTAPEALTSLAAISIGGGGGLAYYASNGGWDYGYAGSAGGVQYSDLTQVENGKVFQIVVGGGGTTALNSPTNGAATTITSGAQTLTGAGGLAGSQNSYCTVGTNGMNGVGEGAGGNTTSRAGETCVQAPAFDLSAVLPTLFPTNDLVIGLGGMMYNTGSRPALKPGSGASGLLTTAEPSAWVSRDAKGADGAAVFRWRSQGLANTGTNSDQMMTWAFASLVFGAALISASRIRVRRSPARHRS